MNIPILITTYNNEATIAEVIRSIRAQGESLKKVSYVLIADDGSTDRTLEIIHSEWEGCSVRLEILKRNKNMGEWRNVKNAIESLSEQVEWVLMLHSDDPLKPHWLTTMVDAIQNSTKDIAIICSSYDSRRQNGTIITGEDKPGAAYVKVMGGVASLRMTLLKGCWWKNSGCVLRRSAFRDIGKISLEWKQRWDWEFFLRVLHGGWSVLYIPRTLFVYAQREGSLTSGALRKDLDLREGVKIFEKFIQYARITDVLQFYFSHCIVSLRRMVRAITRWDANRFFKALQTLTLIIRSMFYSLKIKLFGGAPSV